MRTITLNMPDSLGMENREVAMLVAAVCMSRENFRSVKPLKSLA